MAKIRNLFGRLAGMCLTAVATRAALPGTLQPGWNTVWWEGHGEGTYWGGVDFHKLEVIDRPHATMLLIK